MTEKEKKSGRRIYKNLNISKTKSAFSMKPKAFFIVFEGLSLGEK